MPQRWRSILSVAVVASIVAGPGVGAAATLAFIPGTDSARAVSADGSIVTTNGDGVGRWTATGGLEPLPAPPGLDYREAWAMSDDGSTVVGIGWSPTHYQPFRWTAAGGTELLGVFPGSYSSYATAAGGDGSVVVGTDFANSTDFGEAWRWTPAGGLQRLPGADAYNGSQALGISADGTVIAGQVRMGQIQLPFRWTAGQGFDVVTEPGPLVTVKGISGDGNVIFGEGFRWTAADGYQSVGAAGTASSFDGAVIVGDGGGQIFGGAVIWDEVHGDRDLTDLAKGLGLDLQGYVFERALDVSADGMTIVGRAARPGPDGIVEAQGYVLTLPEPAGAFTLLACAAAAVTARPARRSRERIRQSEARLAQDARSLSLPMPMCLSKPI